MKYSVAFISLGCAKNQVNCEQMMATVTAAGHTVASAPEGADVAVVNTCGFLASACEEAIDNILEMGALKKAGKVQKILVTGCMAQRYQEDVMGELPEVDGVLGTGSYGDVAAAVDAVMAGERPCRFGSIHTAEQEGERVLSTPGWYGGLRQPLRLLRHSLSARKIPQPPHEAPFGGSRRFSGPGREGTDCDCAGYHPVWNRPDG